MRHVVTLLGAKSAGKTSLCLQWSGSLPSSSYVMTMNVQPYFFPLMVIYDTPSDERFNKDIESLYEKTDVFILMCREDGYYSDIYTNIIRKWPKKRWLLILNGDQPFRQRRRWALCYDIRVLNINISTGYGLNEAMDYLLEMLPEIDHRQVGVDLESVGSLLDVLYSSCV